MRWLLLSAAVLAKPAIGAGVADDVGISAQFGGCDIAGWCRFTLEHDDPLAEPRRVRPIGVADAQGDDALARAVRERLNALLSSMIHQHKRIRVFGLRALPDGTYSATVTVNEADVASDPALQDLRAQPKSR